MILFQSDYLEGAHENVMRALERTNLEQSAGYGEDAHCQNAAQLIRTLCQAPDAAVHFLVGGTQTNLTLIAAALRPHQGVLCAQNGHINVHETGAVESCGHKVLPLAAHEGKITAQQVKQAFDAHWADATHEHMPQPAMVYISFPTEYGTLYSKEELTALYETCRACDLLLYIDGARLSYGLTAQENDVSLSQLASLCDAFYLGGTKCGALFGEALVIRNDALKRDFRYIMKQRGGMLAKGRLLGVQFEALLQDGTYFDAARAANERAYRIREAFLQKGVPMLIASPTNQQFPILSDEAIARLAKDFGFSHWERVDETHCAVRFCTSWATSDAQVDTLLRAIEEL